MNILEYLTKENITLVIAIIGALGTIVTAITKIWNNRVKLDITFAGIMDIELKDAALIYLMISNQSRLPISITAISVLHNDFFLQCETIPQIAYRNNVVNSDFRYTLTFPIDIQGLCSASGYILFEFAPDTFQQFSNTVNLRISTNRGKVIEIEQTYEQVRHLD